MLAKVTARPMRLIASSAQSPLHSTPLGEVQAADGNGEALQAESPPSERQASVRFLFTQARHPVQTAGRCHPVHVRQVPRCWRGSKRSTYW